MINTASKSSDALGNSLVHGQFGLVLLVFECGSSCFECCSRVVDLSIGLVALCMHAMIGKNACDFRVLSYAAQPMQAELTCGGPQEGMSLPMPAAGMQLIRNHVFILCFLLVT